MATTPTQIAALKYLIFESQDGTNLSKRVLAFLLDASEKMTQSVCLSLVEDREGYSADEIGRAAVGVGSMQSSNGTTHLDALLKATRSELGFSVHYGDFDPSREDDPFNFEVDQVTRPGLVKKGMPLRYTFWLSEEWYSRDAKLIPVTREELKQISLKKPGLYPTIEAAMIP